MRKSQIPESLVLPLPSLLLPLSTARSLTYTWGVAVKMRAGRKKTSLTWSGKDMKQAAKWSKEMLWRENENRKGNEDVTPVSIGKSSYFRKNVYLENNSQGNRLHDQNIS